ncbi:MAG: Glu/Leu/Phe/Val family dehydrogenase, partial [Alcaligenes sp.]
GTVYNPNGLDVLALLNHMEQHKGLAGAPNTEAIANEDFWHIETDLLIPAALEGQINKNNADRIRARIVIEGANGPTTPEADDILNDKGVTIVPDVVANAGGVTVSYFEWVQDFSSFFWTEAEINNRLEMMMRSAYTTVAAVAKEHNVTLRTAAFIVGCARILESRQVRGLYP